MDLINRYQGCLVGGAVGDALGYNVEMNGYESIKEKYGDNGITRYQLRNGIAQISDKTQLTLFTATGLISGKQEIIDKKVDNLKLIDKKIIYINNIYKSYLDWQDLQNGELGKYRKNISWLCNVKELKETRFPDLTTLIALASDVCGTIDDPINFSKESNGMVHIAPIPLFFHNSLNDIDTGLIAASVSAITHGSELVHIASFMLSVIIYHLLENEELNKVIRYALKLTKESFNQSIYIQNFTSLIKLAIKLSNDNLNDLEAITMLGTGFNADEALAISIYTCLKYQSDFEKGLIVACNHSGDSISTSTIYGNIMGTYLGYKQIPSYYIDNLEIKDIIKEISDDLYQCSNIMNKIII